MNTFEDEWLVEDIRIRDRAQKIRDKPTSKQLRSGDFFSDKATAKVHKAEAKAQAIEFAHYTKTGRWIFGFPPADGWYRDPTGRFAERYFVLAGSFGSLAKMDRGSWTDKVRDSARLETANPLQ